MTSGATISDDGTYRYLLWREWDVTKPSLGWIMLNPSTADASANDPTVHLTMSLAKRWLYGGVMIANLFAYRSPHPRELLRQVHPIGPDNNKAIIRLLNNCRVVVLAWGSHGADRQDRVKDVLKLIDEYDPPPKLVHLGLTNRKQPMHPLGVMGPIKLIPYKGM